MSIFIIHPEIESVAGMVQQLAAAFEIIGSRQSAQDALEDLTLLKPDVILSSLDLPDMPCTELLQALAELDTAIVATSQWSTFAYEALRFGAIGFLLEPLQVEDLNEIMPRIEQRLREKRILREAWGFSSEMG